jgi:hypothetical protein
MHREVVDQVALEHVVKPRPDWFKFKDLPASYVAIFDGNMSPESEWVVSHHQASRRFRSP